MNCTENKKTKLSLGWPTVLPRSTCAGHVTSSVTWPFDTHISFPINWRSFGTKPLSLNCFRDTRRRM